MTTSQTLYYRTSLCALFLACAMSSPVFQVNDFSTSYQVDQEVTALGEDKMVFVWESENQDGSGYGVFARVMSVTGEEILPEFQVNTHTLKHQDDASVTSLGNDKFVVAWESDEQDNIGTSFLNNGVYARVISITGEDILPEFRVNELTDDHQGNPSVSALDDKHFVIAWDDIGHDGSGLGVYARVISITGESILPAFRVNEITEDDQHNPEVAAVGSDKFVVVWQSYQRGEGTNVYGRMMNTAGQDVLSEFRVNNNRIENKTQGSAPFVASIGDDKFAITWERYDSREAFARVMSTTGEDVVPEFRVNNQENAFRNPDVAALGDTKFVLAYGGEAFGPDWENVAMYARVISVTGEDVLPEFQVNDASEYIHRPSVAGIGDSWIVVAWEQYREDDTSAYGLEPADVVARVVRLETKDVDTEAPPTGIQPVCEDQTAGSTCISSGCCASGLLCYEQNMWYAQCMQPGTCMSSYGHLTGEFAWSCDLHLPSSLASQRSLPPAEEAALPAPERRRSAVDGSSTDAESEWQAAPLVWGAAAACGVLAAVAAVMRVRGSAPPAPPACETPGLLAAPHASLKAVELLAPAPDDAV